MKFTTDRVKKKKRIFELLANFPNTSKIYVTRRLIRNGNVVKVCICLWFCFTGYRFYRFCFNVLKAVWLGVRSAKATTQISLNLKLPFAAFYTQSRGMSDTPTSLASKNGSVIMTTSN